MYDLFIEPVGQHPQLECSRYDEPISNTLSRFHKSLRVTSLATVMEGRMEGRKILKPVDHHFAAIEVWKGVV